MATLAIPIPFDRAISPNVVKVVRDHSNRAMYFSRCPIPYNSSRYLKHIGVYAYRVDTLALLCALPPAEIEQSESLEQLRALDHGIGIDVILTTQDTIAVDTPQDIELVEEHLRQVV
jgi:3-deoxy-manno-octulosonate cytidylyltransferase (CMP-KDO synthetase)